MSTDSTPIIFISYRRGEQYPDEHVARGLHDSLASEFGPDALFRDVNDSHQMISRNFREVLIDVINQSTVCVVVIGPKWIDDIHRLHNSDDFVRMEILEFLRRPGVGVIPVTVGGATFPNRTELPAELRGLVDYGGVAISNDSAQSSIDKIVAAIKTRESSTNSKALEKKSNYAKSSSKDLQSKRTNLLRTIFKASIAIIVAGIIGWLILIAFFQETYESCLKDATMTEKIECHEKYGQS